jgi:hypothetical protein
MFQVLNSYLFQHKSISIPGLGTIYVEALPSSIDTSTKNILPPLNYFRFDKQTDSPDRQFYSYIASQEDIPDYDALKKYNDFAFDLRERINREDQMTWDGVGVLKKDQEGNIVFETAFSSPPFYQPVPAHKVIHPDAQHVLLVGDTERTNVEMNEWLQQEQGKRTMKSWWIYALVVAIIALLIILFHFSSSGWSLDSSGNQQKLQTEK